MSQTTKIVLIVVGIVVGVIVLAIIVISILATISLSALNSARTKASDSSVKANMNNISAQAAIYYDSNNGGYGDMVSLCTKGVFSDPAIANQLDQAIVSSAIGAHSYCSTDDKGQNFAVIVGPLKSNPTNYWCVDSLGSRRIVTTTAFTNAGICP